jgi:ribosomal protein RSM22 (predicted rRNA methylase)
LSHLFVLFLFVDLLVTFFKCPHDASCPLFHSGSSQLTCGFSQRLQVPDFVRRTKHTGMSHEDVTYSYVAIRRGPRPLPTSTQVGRIGGVGQDAINKQLAFHQMKELEPYSDQIKNDAEPVHTPDMMEVGTLESPEELQTVLRQEAYSWPRLIFPPLKRSGHIIIDGCTPEGTKHVVFQCVPFMIDANAGKIMRMTIPKSQGKQAYYDARKSAWGDIFPHEPKNSPQERYTPASTKGAVATKGADIGKRNGTEERARWSEKRTSYDAIAKEIKKSKKRLKWARPSEDAHGVL